MTNSVTSLPTLTAFADQAPTFTVALPTNFPLAITPEQGRELQMRLDAFDFSTLTMADIRATASASEMNFSKVLDSFLARIDSQGSHQLFRLVDELSEAIDQEKLPELTDRILDSRPPLLTRLLGLIYPRALKRAAIRVWEETARIASGSTKKLHDHVNAIEKKLREALSRMDGEMRQFEAVKQAYQEAFVSFALDTAFLHSMLLKSRAQFEQQREELTKDPQKLMDAEDRLQALESRALAIEGSMSRLPADQLVLRQLQMAGQSTFQELTTTAAGRFANIKMTLLSVHGALDIRNAQRLGEQGAALERNLDATRKRLTAEVTTKAANMPGDNRLQQAQGIADVVKATRELVELAAAARKENQSKFEQARTMLAASRQEMLTLGAALQPNTAYGH